MHDDALVRAWMANDEAPGEPIRRAVDAALVQDRSEHDKGRLMRQLSLGCAALLWIVLLWCAAHGITPLVRGGYALMATGTAVMLFAGFSFASWKVQARPGAKDSLTQIHTSLALLAREATLARTAPAWCAPTFVGGLMIGWWVYAERSHVVAIVVWTAMVAGWIATLLGGSTIAREFDARRAGLERVLSDLEA